EEPGLKALLTAGGLAAHDPRQKPHTGVDQHIGGDLAARDHIIADRYFFELPRLDHPLVHSLETRRHQHYPRAGCELPNARLIEWFAARRKQQFRTRIVSYRDRIDGAGEDIGTHDHARSAAGRGVVDRTVPALAEVADIDRLARPD